MNDDIPAPTVYEAFQDFDPDDFDPDEFDPDSPWNQIEAMEGGWCCYEAAAADGDVTCCSCWDPVYDLAQHWPVMRGLPPVEGPQCHDCAYRQDSPERSDEWRAENLDALTQGRGMFFCHSGMRRAVAYIHRGTGLVRPAGFGDYQPPIYQDGGMDVPYRADGLPGLICGGWAARYRLNGTPELRTQVRPPTIYCH